jgi:hypothetical protein
VWSESAGQIGVFSIEGLVFGSRVLIFVKDRRKKNSSNIREEQEERRGEEWWDANERIRFVSQASSKPKIRLLGFSLVLT